MFAVMVGDVAWMFGDMRSNSCTDVCRAGAFITTIINVWLRRDALVCMCVGCPLMMACDANTTKGARCSVANSVVGA
jgi:hypothetical protein